MDAYDTKILSLLFEDSRAPTTQIAKRVRLSREVVQYRIEKLQKEGIIKSFVTSIDYKRFGMHIFTVCLALHKASQEQEQEMIDALAKNPHCTWIGPAAGAWNILIDAYAKSREQLDSAFSPFYEKYNHLISNYRISEVETIATWFHKFVAPIKTQPARYISYTTDDKDKQLLLAVADNSRASYVELGKATKLTANACKYRLRNLEKAGVIQGYTLNIEPTVLGYQWYTVELSTTETDAELLRRFYRFCEAHKDIIFYYRMYRSGAGDFYLGFMVKTHLELRRGLNELRQKFPGISVTNLFLPYEQATSHSLPPAVFQQR